VSARPPHEPYREVPAGTFRWRLGVRPLDLADWLVVTDHYHEEITTKARIMADHPDTAFCVLDDVDAECSEIATAVIDHLHRHHPERFGESRLDPDLHPLDAAGRLVQEDLVVMIEREGELVFAGGSVCFPNRWDLRSKLGRTMAEVHEPVTDLNAQLGDTVDGFLRRLTPAKPVWRLGWGVLDTDDLYQPLDGTAGPRPVDAPPAEHHLRVERETLRRFPETGCILFTIHTHLTPLVELPADSATSLASALDAIPTGIAEYKQLDQTGAAIAEWLRETAGV
jgi:hypothetical protein